MAQWVARRLAFAAFALFFVLTAVFLVTRATSDPARHMLSLDASEEQVAQLNAQLGLDRPLPEQYVDFIGDMVTFDFGESLWQRRSAGRVVLERLPATLLLVACAGLITVLVFVPLGVIASIRPGKRLDRFVTALSLIGLSTPQFWLGAILALFFAVNLGALPTSGSGTWTHLVLPSATLAVALGGRLAQVTRTSFIEQLEAPYVLAAQGKGFSLFYILRRHVLRNALPPILTLGAWDLARSITGHAVIVEVVFGYPGFGRLVISAVERDDFVLIQASVFVGAVIIVVINYMTDLLHHQIDRRVEA